MIDSPKSSINMTHCSMQEVDASTDKVLYHTLESEQGSFSEDYDMNVTPPQTCNWRYQIKHPFVIAIIAGSCTLSVFIAGFLLGRTSPYAGFGHPGSLASISRVSDSPPFPELMPPPLRTVFDTLRDLPQIDLYAEYGIDTTETNLYPEPLGKKICIVNVDTREWDVKGGLANQTDLGWSWLNHYLYAQLHGYDYKFVQVPHQEGLYDTWVKLKEQFLLTMKEEYQFVVVTDADIIFNDLRIPFETLLGHWNITSEIAVAGGRDQDDGVAIDRFGRIMLNTGLIITQRTPEFPQLMRDWINCPTDVKYHNCSHWKEVWAHEQSALSEFIRYDYADSIREIESTDMHSPEGKFTSHFWGGQKTHLKEAAQRSIIDRFMPEVLRRLVNTWPAHHESVRTDAMYDLLMYDPLFEEAKKAWESSSGQGDEKSQEISSDIPTEIPKA